MESFKVSKRGIIKAGLILSAALIIFSPQLVSAQMVALTDAQLKEITGQAFSTLTMNTAAGGITTTIRADFDIRVNTATFINELNLGYYRDNANDLDWDVRLLNLGMGRDSPYEPVIFNGVYVEFTFLNIDDPANRDFIGMRGGTDDMYTDYFYLGDIGTLSGYVGALLGQSITGHRANCVLGGLAVNVYNEPFFLSLDRIPFRVVLDRDDNPRNYPDSNHRYPGFGIYLKNISL